MSLIANDCPPLEAPANGRVSVSKNGARARFICKREYTIKGEDILDCNNGRWSSEPPVCVENY